MTYVLIAEIQKQSEERYFEANVIWRIANSTQHKKPIVKQASLQQQN